ncbi:MAG: twin-arginine translocase subunit TatC [Acidiferrobacterales bacterium]
MADVDNPKNSEGSLISHLLELRNRLLYAVIAILIAFVPLAIFSEQLYQQLAAPLLASLPEGSDMIVTHPLQAFLTPIKLALFFAIIITIPFVLYQIWAFVAPGLYKHEQRMVLPLLVSSSLLFYTGMAFAYFVVFPLVFGFLSRVTPEGVQFMPDIKAYQDFVFTLFFAFGVAFELPVALVLLTRLGVINPHTLGKKRPYVVLWTFVVAMLLTPPDPLSQTMLAIPLLILFEIGLFISRRVKPREKDNDSEEMTDAEMEAEMDAALKELDSPFESSRDTQGNKKR